MIFCEVCQVQCNSRQTYDLHCSGRKHLNKAQNSGAMFNSMANPGGMFNAMASARQAHVNPQLAMMVAGGYPLAGAAQTLSFDTPMNNEPYSSKSSVMNILPTVSDGDGSAFCTNPLVAAAMAGGLPMAPEQQAVTQMFGSPDKSMPYTIGGPANLPPVPDPLPDEILALPWKKRAPYVFCEVCAKVCNGIALYLVHCQCKTHIKKVEFLRGTGRPVPDCSAPIVTRRVAASVGVHIHPPKSEVKDEDPDAERPPRPTDFTRISLQQMMSCVRTAVGVDYIEELTDESGNVKFHCKLCDASCLDVKARDVHLCGKRHRAKYRLKVDPSLDMKQRKRKITPPPPSSGIAAKRRAKKLKKLMEEQGATEMDTSVSSSATSTQSAAPAKAEATTPAKAVAATPSKAVAAPAAAKMIGPTQGQPAVQTPQSAQRQTTRNSSRAAKTGASKTPATTAGAQPNGLYQQQMQQLGIDQVQQYQQMQQYYNANGAAAGYQK